MPEPCVVRHWGAPVSCLVMHLQVKLTGFIAVLLALGVCAEGRMQAQASGSSSQTQPTPAAAAPTPDNQTPSYGVYVATDPLANVRYDNRWDLSLGAAYDHMKAGPTLLQGSNLGGLDMNGAFWLSHFFGLEASGRGYIGTSGAGTSNGLTGGNSVDDIKGPVVKEYYFVAGIEALGPHNKHGAILAHAMFGGVYGDFQKDLRGLPPSTVDFYNNQIAPAAIIGGHFDLNRSDRWVFRITPDAIIKRYSINYPPNTTSTDINFAISVGMEYKFTSTKRSNKPGNWKSGW
jgi:hypothetical protein